MVETQVRRRQIDRSEAMRARLLDATVACLVADGYGALSTNDVVRRAGVSRGALVHHFPTKAELVVAAAERLLEQRMADFRAAFVAVPEDERTIGGALEVLWHFFEGPTFAALMELTVAARTNVELRTAFADGPERIAVGALEVFGEMFPGVAELPYAPQLVDAAVALFAGLAMQQMVDGDVPGHGQAVRHLLSTLLGSLSLVPSLPPVPQEQS